MKNIKYNVITAILLLTAASAIAQQKAKDSIKVEFDDKLEVRLGIYDYHSLSATIVKDLKELQEILKGTTDIPENSPYTIAYKPGKKMTIKTYENKETVIWEDGEHSPYKFNNKCEIISDKYLMHIDFNAMDDLKSMCIRYLSEMISHLL